MGGNTATRRLAPSQDACLAVRAFASRASLGQARTASITKSGNLVPMQDRPTCGQIRIELDGAGTAGSLARAWEREKRLVRPVAVSGPFSSLSSPPAADAANGRPRV